MKRAAVKILHTSTGTLHSKHLVAFANVDDQLTHHQVGTERDLGSVKVLRDQEILQQTRIQHDVAMIGHIEVGLRGAQLLQAITRERCDTVGDNLLVDLAHGLRLKVFHCAIVGYSLPHVF